MRLFLVFVFLSLFFVFAGRQAFAVVVPGHKPAFAGEAKGNVEDTKEESHLSGRTFVPFKYCKNAESTSSLLNCLKMQLGSSREKLNEVYDRLKNDVGDEGLADLRELQESWLAYKERECSWQKRVVDNPSLRKLAELDCQIKMTDERVDVLGDMIEGVHKKGDSIAQRQFGELPEWMNAVASEMPHVFWRYGQRVSYDFDCDGVDEFVMQGVLMGEKEKPEAVLVIADVPRTGRPRVNSFLFPVGRGRTEPAVCDVNVNVEFVKQEKKGEEACSRGLRLVSRGCEPVVIFYGGDEGYFIGSKNPDKERNE